MSPEEVAELEKRAALSINRALDGKGDYDTILATLHGFHATPAGAESLERDGPDMLTWSDERMDLKTSALVALVGLTSALFGRDVLETRFGYKP